MAIKTRIENDIKLFVDFTADKSEFEDWTSKVRTQYLRNVEVPGFRKGKAPEHIAIKHVNPQALEQTILQEAVDKYAQGAIKEATDNLTKDNKVVIPGSFIIQPETLKREEGLSFTLKGELLPDVKLDPSKLKVEEPSADKLPDRISYKDFLENQKNGFVSSRATYEPTDKGVDTLYKFKADTTGTVEGKDAPQLTTKDMEGVVGIKQFLPDFEKGIMGMKAGETKSFDVEFPLNYHSSELAGKKATFTAEMKEVSAPKTTDFDKLIHDGSDEALKSVQFKTEKEFDDYIKNYYDQETNQLLEQQRQRNTIKALIDQVDEFSIDEDRVASERDRIFEVIKKNADDQKTSVGEIFKQSGIPGSEKGAKDDMDVKKKIEDYVKSEFKLSTIWDWVYETKIEADQKVTLAQIEKGAEDVKKNPAKFNLGADVSDDQAKNYAYNNLKKNKAAAWLFGELKKQEAPKKEKKTTKAKAKKETKK